jgi:hypothetical protein
MAGIIMHRAQGTKEKLPATPVATPVLHAYVMPDRDLGFIFHTLRRACTRTLALYVRRCSSLLTRLLVVPIPEFNLIFFLRLPTRFALSREHGGPALAPGADFVAFVCGLVFASSTEGREFRAIGRRYLTSQVAKKRTVGRDTGGDHAEVDLYDRPLNDGLGVGIG